MSAHWQQVLDVQLDLLRMWRSPAGTRTAAAFGASMKHAEAEHGNAGGVALADRLQDVQLFSLVRADPFYVDAEMMDVVEAAARTFKPETLQATDFITPAAFVVLPRPMSMIDRHGKECNFRAILWTEAKMIGGDNEKARDGVVLSLYSHLYDEDGYYTENLQTLGADWRERVVAATGSEYSLLHITPWFYGQEFPHRRDPDRMGFWTPVQSFLRLAMQTIAERSEQRPPRASAKRWKRSEHTDKYITVIRLRRPRGEPSHEHGMVNWSHRWIVNGHWRNQWFPSLNEHRQIWIGAHVKGPEDRPLLVRRGRAFEFVK